MDIDEQLPDETIDSTYQNSINDATFLGCSGLNTTLTSTATNDEVEQHRRFILHEFLETERTYVKGLELISEYFIIPLKQNPAQNGVTVDFVQSTFGELSIIYNVNRNFLQQLEQIISENSDNNTIEIELANVLVPWAEAFKLYVPYVNNFRKIMDNISNEQSRNSQFRSFVSEKLDIIGQKIGTSTQISSILITPIQRLPRYKMLFEAIVEKSNSDNQEKNKMLQKALQSVRNAAAYCNQKDTEYENLNKMIELSLDLNKRDLIQPSRKLIMEGKDVSYEQSNKNFGNCNLYLFNDLLVIQKKSAWKAPREIILDRDVLVEKDETNDSVFRITKKQLLTGIDSSPVGNRKRSNPVRVNTNSPRSKGNYLIKFKCITSSECNRWMNSITSATQ